jgi:hypothetical protein
VYCEIYLKHARNVSAPELVAALRAQGLGTEIPFQQAYSWSRIYGSANPKSSLYAHETLQRCFVILRSLNYDVSSFHLEGRENTVSIQTLLEVAQEYVGKQLLPALRSAPKLDASLQAIKLFEDNGRETGLIGKTSTFSSIFVGQFGWSEIHSHIIVFVSAFLLLKLGHEGESLLAAGIGLSIAVGYAILNGLLKYAWNRRRIRFELTER